MGVLFEAEMTFSAHVEETAQQTYGILCYLSRIRHFLTQDATKLLIQSLVLCKLSYCSVVWGGVDWRSVDKLQRMLNFAARVIYRKHRSENVTPLLSQLNWLSVKNRLKLDTACFMYRVAYGHAPRNLCELFPRVRDLSRRTSRQLEDFYEPMAGSRAGGRSLSHRGTRLWNRLSPKLKKCHSLHSFRRQYRKPLLAQQRQLTDWH